MDANIRIYNPAECAVFCKTKEKFGGVSNMSAGFPLKVNDIEIRTSEALYQALRFPLNPEIQKKIIEQKSPMTAKMVTKPLREEYCRKDWMKYHTLFMRWVIRVKLLQNWEAFSRVLLETENLAIVEMSTKRDDFWGAVLIVAPKPQEGKRSVAQPKYVASDQLPLGHLIGYNVMGRLAQELRENRKTGIDQMSKNFTILPPLEVPNFLLCGKPIQEIHRL